MHLAFTFLVAQLRDHHHAPKFRVLLRSALPHNRVAFGVATILVSEVFLIAGAEDDALVIAEMEFHVAFDEHFQLSQAIEPAERQEVRAVHH